MNRERGEGEGSLPSKSVNKIQVVLEKIKMAIHPPPKPETEEERAQRFCSYVEDKNKDRWIGFSRF